MKTSSWARPGLLGLVLLLVGCDHGTKHLAAERLAGEAPLALIPGVLDLRYTENRDVAFSLLRQLGLDGVGRHLGLLATLMLLVLGALWLRERKRATQLEHVGYALAMAGALGNVLDRLVRGYVVDFVHLYHWPVFNVADVAIVAGLGCLLVASRRLTRTG